MIFVARKKNHISQKSCYAKFYYKEDVHCASEKNHPMENHIRRGIANDIYEDSKILTFIKIWDFFNERSMYRRFYYRYNITSFVFCILLSHA